MSQIKIVQTNSNTFFFLDGRTYSISTTDERYKSLLEAAENNDLSRFRMILNPPTKLGTGIDGRLVVYENKATLDDVELPEAIAIRLREHVRAGKDLDPVFCFWKRIQSNPSARAIEESWRFLAHRNMPVTNDGYFIGYKAVRKDYFSQFSGTAIPLQGVTLPDTSSTNHYHIRNMPGDVVELRRREVDDDKDRTCSYGLHVGSIEYVRSFMARQGRIVTVLVDPADIVSVPSDCNGQKVRVCKYTVLGELEGKELNDVLETHSKLTGFDYNNEPEDEEWDFDSDFEDEDDEEFDEIPTSVIAAMEDYPTVSSLTRLSLKSLDDLIDMVRVEISIEENTLAGIKNMQVIQEAWLEDSKYSGLEKTIEDTLERLDAEEQEIHTRICNLEDYLELVVEAEKIRRSGN